MIIEIKERNDDIKSELVRVWGGSVRATHHFLTEDEIMRIKEYVPMAIDGTEHLLAAEQDGRICAFMGISGDELEMLFVSPDERGKGLGKVLLQNGIDEYGVRILTVNEQNPQATGFYEHMGFETVRRSDIDGQGGPYPILYMELRHK